VISATKSDRLPLPHARGRSMKDRSGVFNHLAGNAVD
jgi:hypothetical protein